MDKHYGKHEHSPTNEEIYVVLSLVFCAVTFYPLLKYRILMHITNDSGVTCTRRSRISTETWELKILFMCKQFESSNALSFFWQISQYALIGATNMVLCVSLLWSISQMSAWIKGIGNALSISLLSYLRDETLLSVEEVRGSMVEQWSKKVVGGLFHLPNSFTVLELFSIEIVWSDMIFPLLSRESLYSRLWYKPETWWCGPDIVLLVPKSYYIIDNVGRGCDRMQVCDGIIDVLACKCISPLFWSQSDVVSPAHLCQDYWCKICGSLQHSRSLIHCLYFLLSIVTAYPFLISGALISLSGVATVILRMGIFLASTLVLEGVEWLVFGLSIILKVVASFY